MVTLVGMNETVRCVTHVGHQGMACFWTSTSRDLFDGVKTAKAENVQHCLQGLG
jgi:hypothetical protein